MRAALCVGFTAKPLAVTAILARAKLGAIRVRVGLRGVGRGGHERVVAEVFRRLAEGFGGEAVFERGQRVVTLVETLEGIAAGLNLPRMLPALPEMPKAYSNLS